MIEDSRGAEIAEAAAVLPLMFMILLGIFWFGQAFNLYGAITRAAQEGARAGAAPVCTTCASSGNTPTQTAVTAAQNALTGEHLDYNLARNPTTPPTLNLCLSGGGTAGCQGGANFCVQTPVQLTSTVTGASGVCGVSVSFQYPYQFWLPFTSLNKQQIWLQASARVRMETR